MLLRKPGFKDRIQILGPPMPKNRKLSLFDFHKFTRAQEIPFFFESTFKEKSEWSRLQDELASKDFDIGVIASFGKIIPDDIIEAFP